jgi:hypothetical protein
MRSRHALFAVLAVAVAGLAGSAWLSARTMQRDDRPPIIVRSGSIYFEGGIAGNPDECCNNWKKDLTSNEWKPDPDDKDGVSDFAVTVTGVPSAVCSMNDVRGQQVLIYFQFGNERNRDWSLFRVRIAAKHGFGKREPKIVAPRKLKDLDGTSPSVPGVLTDDRAGFISGIRVDNEACGFDESHKRDLRIKIQPKRID